jgi:hypothetical protein
MSLYHLHFRIEFLFWYLSLRVPVYLGRKGESVFYDLNIFRLVLRVRGLSSYTFFFFG